MKEVIGNIKRMTETITIPRDLINLNSLVKNDEDDNTYKHNVDGKSVIDINTGINYDKGRGNKRKRLQPHSMR